MLQESYQWFLEHGKEGSGGSSPHRKPVKESILRLIRFFS
jgi:hypothetical protein